ncbi:PDR/VanB family oxidoreductase [Pusillimonas sp.]|uniref:PDR/VanB family oxidoreductase n=1 Tax=Pusillimonas sp. TaxID=3040095 RepID=UPI0029A2AC54|nr:PDR/VanB family oxidoreductase [Pusillimonas sp.]MDX3895581.1 PDR/VanB family oxidoreductase [Pusillimonas sp.]
MSKGPGRLRVRLQSIRYAARDIHLFELAKAEGGTLPPAAPGAHIDLHLGNGLVRSYSLVNAGTAPDCYVIGIKHDAAGRGGSRWAHQQWRVGSELDISAPRNNFPLDEQAPHTVLFAGGVGIMPIWCMAQRLRAIGASWELWYAARSRAEAAFMHELLESSGHVRMHYDDEAGRIFDIAAAVAAAPAQAHLYCCGPTAMLDAFEAAAIGRAPETVHLERFAAKEASATTGGFLVHLARSGQELAVPPGASVLEVLQAHGVHLDVSCQEGICGSCEVAVIDGEVDHRDSVLTKAQQASNKMMMVCCSGAHSARLVLDL